MWRCLSFLALILCFQTLRACECGKSKRSSLMERSYLSPLAQSNYDVAAMRPNQFLTPKLPYALPMAATNKPHTMNYNLASKALQNQRPPSSYSLAETTPNALARPTIDPASKLSDLISLRLTLKAQKEAIKTMEDQLSLQISEAVRQFGGGDDPTRRTPINELYPTQAQAALNYQAPAVPPVNPYPSPVNYGAVNANEMYQLGARKELEGQEAASAVKPLMAQQMAAYSPYSGYSAAAAAAKSATPQSYTGGSFPTSLGYQTALV